MLHLGCGVGGVAFALSKHFGRVVGVDASSTFVRHARIMQHHGQEEYERVREGILTETTLVRARCEVCVCLRPFARVKVPFCWHVYGSHFIAAFGWH